MDGGNGTSTIRFSVFELDLKAGELRRNGSRVRLQEQPLQILVSLLERPGEVVGRDELRKKLWAADTFVDFDHSLNAAIRRLRDALGDSADTPRFVETVARRGYRFIAPLSQPLPSAAIPVPGARHETGPGEGAEPPQPFPGNASPSGRWPSPSLLHWLRALLSRGVSATAPAGRLRIPSAGLRQTAPSCPSPVLRSPPVGNTWHSLTRLELTCAR